MSATVSKRQNLLITAAIALLVGGVAVVWVLASRPSTDIGYDKTVTLDVDHPTYDDINALKNDAEYIFTGKVEGAGRLSKEKSRPQDDLTDPSPFTEYTVKVEEVMKGTIDDKTITFRQLGGVSDRTLYAPEDYPVLKSGDRYIFFAIKGDGVYGALAGGYAVAEVNDSKFNISDKTGIKKSEAVDVSSLK